jgi:hypothetical protein
MTCFTERDQNILYRFLRVTLERLGFRREALAKGSPGISDNLEIRALEAGDKLVLVSPTSGL